MDIASIFVTMPCGAYLCIPGHIHCSCSIPYPSFLFSKSCPFLIQFFTCERAAGRERERKSTHSYACETHVEACIIIVIPLASRKARNPLRAAEIYGPITAAGQSATEEVVIAGLAVDSWGRSGVNFLPAWEIPCSKSAQPSLSKQYSKRSLWLPYLDIATQSRKTPNRRTTHVTGNSPLLCLPSALLIQYNYIDTTAQS